jgi:alanine dehydrogenase
VTVFLTDADVRSVFQWPLAIAALRDAYAQDLDVRRYPPRTMARGESSWLRTLSGVAADTGLMGAKLIAVSLATRRASYLIPLFDQTSAELVTLLDGQSITGYRTAATSALAANLLSTSGSLTLGVIGSGFEAQNHIRAIAAVRDLKAVRVYSPREASRTRCVDALSDLTTSVVPVETPEAAVAEASLVICAARSRDESPTLYAEWLSPGATVVSIGSTLPEQREVDTAVIDRAAFMVSDMVEEVLDDTGDLIAACAAGIDATAKTCSLADLVSGRHPGRTADDQIALYKSVGSAVQDLAVASMCARAAQELGLGFPMPVSILPVQK